MFRAIPRRIQQRARPESITYSRRGKETTELASTSTRRRDVASILLLLAGVVASYHVVLRSWHRTWGATDEEVSGQLPGDDLVPEPSDETTRAVTVDASSDDVWPWIVQLGQGRGGFYSYTWLENLAGAGIHNVDRVVPELQDLEEGDSIRMVREDYWLQSPITSMVVERIEPGRTMVLQDHDGGTWTFHLEPIDETTTRFIVRGRKSGTETSVGYLSRYLVYELPHYIMERGMMVGIKARAEGTV